VGTLAEEVLPEGIPTEEIAGIVIIFTRASIAHQGVLRVTALRGEVVKQDLDCVRHFMLPLAAS